MRAKGRGNITGRGGEARRDRLSGRVPSRLGARARLLAARWVRFKHRFRAGLSITSRCLAIVSGVMAAACIVGLVLLVGFDHTTTSRTSIKVILVVAQAVFLARILFDLIFRFRQTKETNGVLKWVVDTAMLVTLIPLLYPSPSHPWVPFLAKIIYSPYLLYGILAAYSVTDLSYGLIKLAGRRTNPALMLGSAFAVFIVVGSLLLMMPRAVTAPISWTDSFFVATSAVSITGLSTLDIASTFTPLGQTILCVLLQVGGIGIITFTSFFAVFFSGDRSIYSQLLIRDMIYTKSMSALIPTLLYIIAFTLTIEVIGAAAIYLTIPDEVLGPDQSKVLTAVFLSMSSFCNAGFTNIDGGMANPVLLHGDQSIYLVTSVLIFAGAIGFPILVNLREIVVRKIRDMIGRARHARQPSPFHLYDLNTKLVLVTTISILVIGAGVFFLVESNRSMAGMSLYDRVVQSVFNALTPRSAGFVSINPASFASLTLLVVMIQMWIGGASQSMAGGIKVNTVAALLLNLRSIIRGRRNVSAYDRNIAIPSVRRANAMLTLSLITVCAVAITLLALERELPTRDLVFESLSAVFTVGSSTGITPDLSTASKFVLCAAMFFGRVGLLSLLTGFFSQSHDPTPYYPNENIIIN